jgi:hypothetical protein
MVKALDPALLARRNSVDLNEGRPWAGDLYDEGPVSDPAEAFAHFQMEASPDPTDPDATEAGDVEAWLDRNEDGSLVGWIREGTEVYRYSDSSAWALDVDGAQMGRVDSGTSLDPNAVAPGAEGLEPPVPDPNADPATDPAAVDPNADPTLDPAADPALAPEADAIAEEEDLEGEDNPFADLGEFVPDDTKNPDAATDELTDPEGKPVEPEQDPEKDPAINPDEPADPNPEPEADPAKPDDPAKDPLDDENETPGGENEADRLFGGKKKRQRKDALPTLALKVYPGPRRFEHKAHFAGECDSGGRGDKEPSPSADTSAPAAPSTPSARRAAGQPPAKATLPASAMSNLSDPELESLTEQPDLYDFDTLAAAAQELDSRNGPSAADDLLAAVASTPRGSQARADLFNVIPDEWTNWVALRNKNAAKVSRNKAELARQDFRDYKYERWLEAERATKGNMWAAKYKHTPKARPRGVTEEGMLTNRAMAAKYGSPELREWLDQNPLLTFAEWSNGGGLQGVRSDLYT